MTSLTVDGGVLTIETSKPHGYKFGETVTFSVQGKQDRWLVTKVHSPTKFSAIQDKRPRNQRRIDKANIRKMGL